MKKISDLGTTVSVIGSMIMEAEAITKASEILKKETITIQLESSIL